MKFDISSFFSQPDGNISAELVLLNKKYNLLGFNTEISQSVDHKGEPQSEVGGGQLQLMLSEIPDNVLLQWAASKWLKRTGEIVFKNETGTPPLRILFTEASLVRLTQQVESSAGVITRLLITPKEVSFNGVTLFNNWRD